MSSSASQDIPEDEPFTIWTIYISKLIKLRCIFTDAGIENEDSLVFKDEDGDYVTNLAFRTTLQQENSDAENFSASFQDFDGSQDSKNFMSASM